MTEGFKGTVIGGVIGILIIALGMLTYYRITEIKPDWVIVVTIPIACALTGWYIAYSNRANDELIRKIESKAEQKIMDEKIGWLNDKVEEHITTDNLLYCQLSEKIENMNKDVNDNFKSLTELIIRNLKGKK